MQREQRGKVLRVALFSGALILIVLGLGVALAGEWFGWLIAAFGVLDAATIPFVLRVIESRGSGAADPSHNPYARED